jgi:dUTP pyrophosphatase
MELKFKKLNEKAVLPTRAHSTDAGLDLTTYGFTQEVDASGKLVLVYHTGLAVEIPEGHMGLIFMRSSVANKSLVLTNAVGVVDHLFSGEITMKFKVTTDSIPTVYQEGERIGQLIVVPYPQFEPVFVEEIAEGARGANGYGSTDATTTEPVENIAEEVEELNN